MFPVIFRLVTVHLRGSCAYFPNPPFLTPCILGWILGDNGGVSANTIYNSDIFRGCWESFPTLRTIHNILFVFIKFPIGIPYHSGMSSSDSSSWDPPEYSDSDGPPSATYELPEEIDADEKHPFTTRAKWIQDTLERSDLKMFLSDRVGVLCPDDFRRMYASHLRGDHNCDRSLPYLFTLKERLTKQVKRDLRPSLFELDWTTFSVEPVENGEVVTIFYKWRAKFGNSSNEVLHDAKVVGPHIPI
jgi:hypothetical protein